MCCPDFLPMRRLLTTSPRDRILLGKGIDMQETTQPVVTQSYVHMVVRGQVISLPRNGLRN